MFKKKLIALGIMGTLLMTSALTGCSKPAEEAPAETPTDAPAAEEVVEVDIFQFKVEIVEALEEAVVAYEAENPNVKINLQTVGGGDDYGAALRAQFQSGNEPDIYNVGGPQDVKDWMDKLEDLSSEPWASQALEGVLSGVTVDGGVYGLPYNIEGYGLAYNKAIFEDAGIDASTIKDYASLDAALATLQTKLIMVI